MKTDDRWCTLTPSLLTAALDALFQADSIFSNSCLVSTEKYLVCWPAVLKSRQCCRSSTVWVSFTTLKDDVYNLYVISHADQSSALLCSIIFGMSKKKNKVTYHFKIWNRVILSMKTRLKSKKNPKILLINQWVMAPHHRGIVTMICHAANQVTPINTIPWVALKIASPATEYVQFFWHPLFFGRGEQDLDIIRSD